MRERFPAELKAYRSKANHLRNGLVVVIDADRQEIADRARGFDVACDKQNLTPRQPDERILYVIPKRNIETWLAYLRGETVDEEQTFPKYACQSECHTDADKLDAMCKAGQLGAAPPPPPSLERCCEEFQTFWRLLQ